MYAFAPGWDGEGNGGGTYPMRQTQRHIAEQGATATQWRIHTPICAPSRSEMQSGKRLTAASHTKQTNKRGGGNLAPLMSTFFFIITAYYPPPCV